MSLSVPSSFSSSQVQIRCKGLLFDMDGILIASLESVERAWRRWAVIRGVDPDLACQTAHGCRAVDTFAKLRPDLDAAEEIAILENFEMTDFDDVVPLPGALELLKSLPADRWTVVTSASDQVARVRLKAGGIPVPSRIVVAEDVKCGKPNPDPYLAGAKLLGFPPEECVVFEDSSSGAQAGRAAGCTVVATTFSHPIDTLDSAHYLITDLTGVEVEALPNSQGLTLKITPLPA
jgi:sugar-phosphatase